jgi:arsenate reductase (glutaredoxin)
MADITLYGIPNCDTVKRARAWLAERNLAYRFHDYKKDGVPEDKLRDWLAEFGREVLINRKGTTWRKLSAADQAASESDAGAMALMLREPSCIKRPVLELKNKNLVGFDEAAWNKLF